MGLMSPVEQGGIVELLFTRGALESFVAYKVKRCVLRLL